LYPATAEVLAVQDKTTECCTVCTPVPDREIVTGEFVALLAIVIFPERSTAVVGVNLTLSVAVPPAAITCPDTTPDEVYPVPVTVTLDTVTLELPAFVSVTLRELLLPTFTFPKLRLVALAFNRRVDATPVPESEIERGDVPLLFVSEIEPFIRPATLGANVTLNVVFPPAAIFAGTVSPLMLNPVPVTVA
jgi:hypothetical protein